MRPRALLLQSLSYYWRTNVAVVLGVATAVAVLAGALLVGDSVRGSLRDLVLRLARLTCQIFNSNYCMIMLVDSTKRYSVLKCIINNDKRLVIDKKKALSGRIERKIIKEISSVRKRWSN